jgi:hypothetical protein
MNYKDDRRPAKESLFLFFNAPTFKMATQSIIS